jgi:hypothetical protein
VGETRPAIALAAIVALAALALASMLLEPDHLALLNYLNRTLLA